MPPPKEGRADRPEQKLDPGGKSVNSFSNDGSFLEQFKKKKIETEATETVTVKSSDAEFETRKKESDTEEKVPDKCSEKPASKPAMKFGQFSGKRKSLMKGQPKPKKKKEEEDFSGKSAPWKAYMAEVKRYKDQTCTDDSNTVRPLVK